MTKTLIELARMTDDEARAYLESLIWPNGPVCPHCGSVETFRLNGESHRAGLLKCKACREQFTVTVGSIMEDSHIPLTKWVLGFHFLCSSKKGMSAKQLQRELGFGSYETAWFMSHRIREAMDNGPLEKALKGTVEMDETYVGGKPRPGDGKEHKRGRGTSKTPVVVAVERKGKSQAEPVEHVDTKTLKAIACANVDETAILMTDELSVYPGVAKGFAGHETVNHGEGQYVRYTADKTINTNTAESFFSLLKRGHYGTYHKMSAKHLGRYCDEFSFRWDHRKVTDGERTESAIEGMTGKRLMYKALVGKTD